MTVSSTGSLAVQSGANLDVESGATLDLKSGSTATISTLLTMNGTDGGIKYRTGTLGDADANLDVGTDEYRFTASPTVPRTFTLLETSGNTPVDGQRIRVLHTQSFPLAAATFERETGPTTIAQFPTGGPGMVEFTYHAAASAWYVSSFSGTATASTVA